MTEVEPAILKGVEQSQIVMRIPDISYSGARTYTMNNVYKSKASALGISISAISHHWTPPRIRSYVSRTLSLNFDHIGLLSQLLSSR